MTVFGPVAAVVMALVLAARIVYGVGYVRRDSLMLLLLLLGNHFSGIKFNQHSPVCFQFLNRYGQSKIVQEEKLKFQVIELDEGKPSDL